MSKDGLLVNISLAEAERWSETLSTMYVNVMTPLGKIRGSILNELKDTGWIRELLYEAIDQGSIERVLQNSPESIILFMSLSRREREVFTMDMAIISVPSRGPSPLTSG